HGKAGRDLEAVDGVYCRGAVHWHSNFRRRALILSPKLQFALSTSMLDYGCFTEAKRCVIFNFHTNP
ncbi:hypothetical protein Tco_0387766, partial [Tanacetum coccineum]